MENARGTIEADGQYALLNFGNLPPPGSAGSMFTPLPGLDGMILLPGQITSSLLVPEPGSLLIAGQGLLGLAGVFSFRILRKRFHA